MPKTNIQREVRTLQKTVGVPIMKEALSKTSKGTLMVPGFFTSDKMDEHGDIITRDATKKAVAKYRQWGNIRRMHQPDPVGKVVGIGEEDGLEWNEIRIEVIDPDAIFQVESGLLQALSIGAMVNFEDIDWLESGGMVINAYLLGEISLVDHPGNYDAILNTKSVDLDLQRLVHRYGMEKVGVGLLNLIEENTDMTDIVKEHEQTESVELENEIEVSDNADSSDAILDDTTPVEAVEAAADEEDVVSEPEEETETPTIIVATIDGVQPEVVDDGQEDAFERLENVIKSLADRIEALRTLVEQAQAIETVVSTEITEDLETGDGGSVEASIPEDAHKAILGVGDETPKKDASTQKDVTTRLHRALEAHFSK